MHIEKSNKITHKEGIGEQYEKRGKPGITKSKTKFRTDKKQENTEH